MADAPQYRTESTPLDLLCRVDMTAGERLRSELGSEGREIPYDAVFIFAVSRILPAFPKFLAGTDRAAGAREAGLTIAFLAGFSDGVRSLNVRDANLKSAPQIAATVRRQVFRAARRELTDEDTTGACFTISNLSKYPVHAFAPVLPAGQKAILGIGAVEETPVVDDGTVVAARICNVTLTVDYRSVNGTEAGRFLASLKKTLEAL